MMEKRVIGAEPTTLKLIRHVALVDLGEGAQIDQIVAVRRGHFRLDSLTG